MYTKLVSVILLSLPRLVDGQIEIHPRKASGVKISLVANGQEITNIPTLRPFGPRGDTAVYNQTGSEGAKWGFAVSYYNVRPLTSHLSLQGSVGFRKRGFLTDTRFDRQTGFAVTSAMNTNALDNVFFDFGLRIHTGAGRRLIGFASFSNRLDYLVGTKTPFWGDGPVLYRRIEFSPVFQAGVSFVYGLGGKRCSIEVEGNPGVMNALRQANGVVNYKPIGSYPAIPIQDAQKIARNYSMALSVAFDL